MVNQCIAAGCFNPMSSLRSDVELFNAGAVVKSSDRILGNFGFVTKWNKANYFNQFLQRLTFIYKEGAATYIWQSISTAGGTDFPGSELATFR